MWTLPSLLALVLAPTLPLPQDRLELVESAPIETSLDAPDLRPTHEVWIECIDAATASIDIAQFYASDAPPTADGSPRRTRLTGVVEALERAAERGIEIRFLLSERFRELYAELPARLGAHAKIEVRWLDMEPTTGGVMHAKYWVFDEARVFVGSQNFDWRALEHIQELGVLVAQQAIATRFRARFEADWSWAGNAGLLGGGVADGNRPRVGDAVVTAVFSPESPADKRVAGLSWDLPAILQRIDGATESVRVQLLSYSPTDREGTYFAELDNALRAAAARGVDVRLMVADWGKRRGRVEWVQSLQAVPNLTVRFVTIPQASEGFIPFARCIHAKYMVVDGSSAWLGTSNWSRDYFYASRNAGLMVEGGAIPERLHRFHADTWNSPYAYTVDPGADYVPPRVSD
ncbi:MAG: phospholipase D-like domain-containing protein [Planctomycetota bacterium]